MTIDLSGIGPQKPQPDQRGILTFDHLPPDVQRAEDATKVSDYDWLMVTGQTVRSRPATEIERALLEHLGYVLPEKLTTKVEHVTASIRRRTWPQLTQGGN